MTSHLYDALMHVALAVICVLTGLIWAFLAIHGWLAARDLPSLPPLASADAPTARVRVVVAARDEADRIAGSIRRLLDQQGVDLDLVLVDDRSADGTAEHARDAANGDPRLRIVRVDALPDGWLGKCHALHVGGQALDRDWIVFVDADSWLSPDALRRAIAFAQREHAHHLCLLPSFGPNSLLGGATLNMFVMAFLADARRVNRDAPRAYVGIGAFNLISREAHDALDPHRRLRLEVLDDINLGRVIRAFGGRSRCALAPDDLEVHWVRDARSLVRLFEKNQFAALGYSTPKAAIITAMLLLIWAVGGLGWLRADLPGFFASGAMLAAIGGARLVGTRYGWGWTSASLAMLASPPLAAFSIANSCFKALSRRGIRWRDTLYPLHQLRNARKQFVRDMRQAPRDTLAKPPKGSDSNDAGNGPPARGVEPMLTHEHATDGAA